MPGFNHLGDREIADLLTHLRRSWGNDALPVTEADVAAVRARRETNP
jgi:mono/diheme cytochrome c family protein